nr:hypothetical protein [uncultured Acetatifactor sp.]
MDTLSAEPSFRRCGLSVLETSIILDCSSSSDSIIDLLKMMKQIGWDIYNPQGQTEYLPIGDDGMYDWQCEKITESQFYDMVSKKMALREQIGIDLFYKNGIMLSISINRKTVKGKLQM